MLGRDHALLGAVTCLGLAPVVGHLAHVPLSPPEIGVGTVVTSAFALLPDIDEPHSTVSTKLGPLSEVVSKVTNKLSGGHRHATHSLLFAALIGVATRYGLDWRWTAPIIVAFSALLVLRILLPLGIGRRGLIPFVLAAAVTWWTIIHTGSARDWLPYAAFGGVVLHLIGDALTVEGVPFLWPLPFRTAVPLVGHTESMRESILGAAMSLGVLALCWIVVLHPMFDGSYPVSLHFPSVAEVTRHLPTFAR